MAFISIKNKTSRFFIWASLLYLSWFILYEFYVKPHTLMDENLISLIIANASFTLKLLGFTVYQGIENGNMQLIGIDGAHPIWIGSPCNALSLFMFFALFIIAFPGKPKRKIWFIPMGIILIHLTNVFRIICLALINYYKPEYLAFNHTYTFTLLVYSIIFLLWMWWVKTSLSTSSTHEETV